jgi:hypothetical protein
LHEPFPVVVRIRSTCPDAISPLVGVYVAPSAFGEGLNEPSPPLHCPPAQKFTKPLSEMVALLPQAVWFAPALETGEGAKLIVILSATALQFPLPVEVSVSVVCPAVSSAFDGVYSALSVVLFGVNVPPPPLQMPPLAPNTCAAS